MRGAKPLLLLLAAILPFLLPAPPATAHGAGPVMVFVLDVGFEEAVEDPVLRSIASSGGMGLLAETEPGQEVVAAVRASRAHGDVTVMEASPAHLARELLAFRPPDDAFPGVGDQVLVLAFTATADPGTGAVVMGWGSPEQLLGAGGPVPGLTSATTRQAGLVSNIDVPATVARYLGHPPPGIPGNPIEVEGFAPIELHRTYQQYRTVVTPVGVGVLAVGLVALGAGLAILLGAWRPPRRVGRGVAVAMLFAVSLQVAMLPGSWLPDYSWPVVLGTLFGVAGVVTAGALWADRRSPHAAVASVGAAGAALVVVDWLLGWRSLLTPLLGGSAFEGTRFYGLGNSYAGVLVAGLVLGAAMLPPMAGVAVLAAGALFAGSPWTGADLGGAITLFVAAGLWWALAVRRRLGPKEVVAVLGAAVLGAALLVLLHRVAPDPSHVSRGAEGGGGAILGTFLERLRLNLEITARTPVVWPALAGLLVATVAAWRRWPVFEPGFRGHPLWWPATVTLGVAAIVGYVVNDTYGLAAVAFVYLSLALIYPAEVEKMFGRKGKKSQISKPRGWTPSARLL